jgi:hypothetical protein
VVIERSYHEILQIAICATQIRLANRLRRARLTTTGVRYSYTRGNPTKEYRRGRRWRARSPLSPVPTAADDDKPYLPDRGTNDCDKPGWCSGPSYDPVTVVTRVQIPLRASPRSGRCRCLPGWCSGPSYDPVTVVTRVQIPLRAFLLSQLRARSASDERVPRQQKPSKGFESGSEASATSGTTVVQIPLRAYSVANRPRSDAFARATGRAAPEAPPPATPSSRPAPRRR